MNLLTVTNTFVTLLHPPFVKKMNIRVLTAWPWQNKYSFLKMPGCLNS